MTKEEVLAIISKYMTGTDDETIADVETVTEFINNSGVDRSADVEKEWRERYRNRFFGIIPENEKEIFNEDNESKEPEESRENTITIDELLTDVKEKEEE